MREIAQKLSRCSSFGALMDDAFARCPEREAIVYEDWRLTYGDLERYIHQTAHYLRHLGVRKGSRVAILSRNCPEWIIAEFALYQLGAIVVKINWRLTPPEQARMLARNQVSVAFLKAETDAIGAMAPYFFKPQTAAELVAWFTPIANSNSLPFYYYNMPSMSGVSVSVPEFLALGGKAMPTLAGVKFTHNNLMEMSQCLMLDEGRYEVLHGYDEILLCGLSLGATAAVGSTYNYAAKVYNRLLDAFRAGDIAAAARLQQYSVKIVEVIIKHGGGVRGGKAIMRLVGVDCGSCRLPLAPFTEAEYTELKSELEAIDFFNRTK